jgi:hypothetical protein
MPAHECRRDAVFDRIVGRGRFRVEPRVSLDGQFFEDGQAQPATAFQSCTRAATEQDDAPRTIAVSLQPVLRVFPSAGEQLDRSLSQRFRRD